MPWNKKKSYNLLKSHKSKLQTVHIPRRQKREKLQTLSKLINWFNIEASKTCQHQKTS